MEEISGAFEEKRAEPAVPESKKGGKRLMKTEKKPSGSAKKGGRSACIALAVLAAAYLALCAGVTGARRFYPNTVVNGIDCGGMTVQELAAQMNANAEKARSGGVSFALPDGQEIAHVSFAEMPADDYTACAEQAFSDLGCGRSGFLTAGARYLRALFAPERLSVKTAEEAEDAFYALSARVADEIPCDPVEFSADVTEDGQVSITKPMDGRRAVGADAAATIDGMLRDAYFNGGEPSKIVLEPDAEESIYEITPAQTVDLAAERAKLVGQKVNASYDAAEKKIIPGHAGVDIAISDLQSAYDAAAPGETFAVKAAVELPEVTTEQLEKCLFRDVLSSYTTKVGGAPGRHKNVQLTAERINGYVINAGETMKYGPLVTPFTAANGYSPAPGYLKGKTVDMVGGGACQASSTLYAAVLYANLEIVQRVNHGYASDYIGLGLDATVAEGGPEFEFRNNTLYPIKVQADFFTKDKKDYIKITLLGTKTDDHYVKIRSEVLETIPFEEEIVETDELAPGERKVEQTAYTGYRVKTYRNVYAGDGTLLSSTYEATSNYKARNRIVLVGKAAPAADPVTDPTAEPTGDPVMEAPAELETPAEEPTPSEPANTEETA